MKNSDRHNLAKKRRHEDARARKERKQADTRTWQEKARDRDAMSVVEQSPTFARP